MKQGSFFITSLLIALVAVFSVMPMQVFAKSNSNNTVVRGNVDNANNGYKGISGLTVTVSCLTNKGNITNTTKTDANGLYTVDFPVSKCGPYRPVTATVTYNGQTQ